MTDAPFGTLTATPSMVRETCSSDTRIGVP